MDDALVARSLDELYGVARADFIDARDARVKELKASGATAEAAVVAKARKPTVPAWAVDQLARRHPDRVAALLEAGQSLRDAQRRASSGRGSDALRAATRDVRDRVRDLRKAAEAVLDEAGSSPSSHLEDVERTLFTGAVTPEHHDALRRGVLDRPLEGAGFGGVEGLLLLPEPDHGAAGDGGDPGGGADRAATDEEAAAEAERRREEERRRTAARRRLEGQRRDLERSRTDQQRRTERAQAKAEQLRARADAAAAAAADERDQLQRIDDELRDVAQELEQVTPVSS